MCMINGEQPTWKLSEVYGIVYGYRMNISGLCITFFTSFKDNSEYLHYTAFSLTTEMLTFDIVLSREVKRSINNSTKLESLLKMSHTGFARPITPAYWPQVERLDGDEHNEKFLNARYGTFQIMVRRTQLEAVE